MAVPVEWLGNFQVNTGAAATGGQAEPKIIGLSNGNILVAWEEFQDGAIEPGFGSDIIGKIYDAEGKLVRQAFRLNLSTAADDEGDFDIAATNDGGYTLAYLVDQTDFDGVTTTIVWERHDATGNILVDSATVTSESTANARLSDPSITYDQFTGQSFVTYTYTADNGGDTDLFARSISAAGNVSTFYAIGQNSADRDYASAMATLSNGDFVMVYTEDDSNVPGIEFSIIRPDGSIPVSAGFLASGARDPVVAGLAGGGFAVAYASQLENGNIEFRVFDNDGAPVAGPFTIAGGSDQQNEPAIVALPDGDFVIMWDK